MDLFIALAIGGLIAWNIGLTIVLGWLARRVLRTPAVDAPEETPSWPGPANPAARPGDGPPGDVTSTETKTETATALDLSDVPPPPSPPPDAVASTLSPAETEFDPEPEPAPKAEPIAPPADDAAAVLAAFNRLASNFDYENARTLEERWQPVAFRATETGDFDRVADGPLWLIPGEGATHAVIPSLEVVRKWGKFYRSLAGASALQDLGQAYAITEGAMLAIETPALGRMDDDRLVIAAKGRLTGI